MWLDTFQLIAQPIGIEHCTNEENSFWIPPLAFPNIS